jgi:ribonuclease P protein component
VRARYYTAGYDVNDVSVGARIGACCRLETRLLHYGGSAHPACPEGITVHETDVSAQYTSPREDARLPRANEHARRPEDSQTAAREGAETADGVTGRLRRPERLTSGAEFQALFQHGKRVERPSMIVLWRPTDGSRRAGFAVGRQIRGAVLRNRTRRRLREAYRGARDVAPTDVELVVIGRPGALTVSLSGLIEEMRGALRAMAATQGAQ